MLNNPINAVDPTGHRCVGETDECKDEQGRLINGAGESKAEKRKRLRKELHHFERLPSYDQIITIDFLGYSSGINPEELHMLQNEDGTLNNELYYRMGLIARSAAETAAELFPNQPGNNSPRNAFQHAYWNALMTQEFGEDFAEQYTTAHEKRADEPTQEQFMDLHNNEVGRRIGSKYSNAPSNILADIVMKALQNGELYVWDGKHIYFSDDCPLCSVTSR